MPYDPDAFGNWLRKQGCRLVRAIIRWPTPEEGGRVQMPQALYKPDLWEPDHPHGTDVSGWMFP